MISAIRRTYVPAKEQRKRYKCTLWGTGTPTGRRQPCITGMNALHTWALWTGSVGNNLFSGLVSSKYSMIGSCKCSIKHCSIIWTSITGTFKPASRRCMCSNTYRLCQGYAIDNQSRHLAHWIQFRVFFSFLNIKCENSGEVTYATNKTAVKPLTTGQFTCSPPSLIKLTALYSYSMFLKARAGKKPNTSSFKLPAEKFMISSRQEAMHFIGGTNQHALSKRQSFWSRSTTQPVNRDLENVYAVKQFIAFQQRP